MQDWSKVVDLANSRNGCATVGNQIFSANSLRQTLFVSADTVVTATLKARSACYKDIFTTTPDSRPPVTEGLVHLQLQLQLQ